MLDCLTVYLCHAYATFPPSADDSTREPVSSLGRVPAASVRGNAAVFVRGWDSCARMNRIYPKVWTRNVTGCGFEEKGI